MECYVLQNVFPEIRYKKENTKQGESATLRVLDFYMKQPFKIFQGQFWTI